jgi:hypothetical protein
VVDGRTGRARVIEQLVVLASVIVIPNSRLDSCTVMISHCRAVMLVRALSA